MQVVGLMGIAEGVETEVFHQLDAGLDLLVAEGMALAEQVLILTSAIDEDRGAVEPETLVAVFPGLGPGGGADAIGRVGALRGFAVALDQGIDIVEIGLGQTPQLRLDKGCLLVYRAAFSRCKSEALGEAHDLLAALLAEFVDEFDFHGLLTIVLHFGLNEQRVA